MKYFKNLLMCVGAVCAVASTGSAYAKTTLCRAIWTGGKAISFNPLPSTTNTNYYDVYCGTSTATGKKYAVSDISYQINEQINTKSNRGWEYINKIDTYENSKSACKKEFDSRSRASKGEKHYNSCF